MSIVVIGDLILDNYNIVKADRVSPEAPCLVGRSLNKGFLRLGGAGNVALNIRNLTADMVLVGVGCSLYRELLTKNNIPNRVVSSLQQSIKTRFIDEKSRVQIFRYDEEETNLPSDIRESIKRIVRSIELKKYDIAVIVDYKKGLFDREYLALESDRSKINLISTKKTDLSEVVNIKNNRNSTHILVVNNDEYLKMKYEPKIDYTIRTVGEDGIILYKGKKEINRIRGEKIDAFDVTGCGDTVLATVAYSLNKTKFNEDSLYRACKLANYAASRVAMKTGTTPITHEEIRLQENIFLGDINGNDKK